MTRIKPKSLIIVTNPYQGLYEVTQYEKYEGEQSDRKI